MKKLLLLLAALLPMAANAYNAKIGGIYYNFSEYLATVTYGSSSSNSYSGIIVIPSTVTYNGITYIVTSIGDKAFKDCSGMTSITIPESMINISSSAFEGCSSLTYVTLNSNAFVSATRTSDTSMKSIFGNQVQKYQLGEDVKSIGDYAFYDCSGMTSITIPNSVTSIGGHAFYQCI